MLQINFIKLMDVDERIGFSFIILCIGEFVIFCYFFRLKN